MLRFFRRKAKSCCCPTCQRFIYKRFPPSFGQVTAHDPILPPDDPNWPLYPNDYAVPSQRGTANLSYQGYNSSPSGYWHLGGRVYDSSWTVQYDIGETPDYPTDVTISQALGFFHVDDQARVYWGFYKTEGLYQILEIYRYDPNTTSHELVIRWGYEEDNRQVGLFAAAPVRLCDIRGNYVLICGIGAAQGADPRQDRLTMFYIDDGEGTGSYADTGTGSPGGGFSSVGIELWDRVLAGDIASRCNVPGEAVSEPTVYMVRLGADGAAYASGGAANRSGNIGYVTDLQPCFWQFEVATGDEIRTYGRYLGGEDNDNESYPNNIKLSSARSFDVDSSGNVVIAVAAYTGRGIAYLSPIDPETGTGTDPGDDWTVGNRNTYAADGYEEDWIVTDGRALPERGSMGLTAGLVEWVVHDGATGAYYSRVGKLAHTDGVSLEDWSRDYGISPSGAPLGPAWIRRDDNNYYHTTGGVYDPDDEDCDLPPAQHCCERWDSEFTMPVTNMGCSDEIATVTMTEIANSSPRTWTGDAVFECGDTHTIIFECDEGGGSGCNNKVKVTVLPGCGNSEPLYSEITGCDCSTNPPSFTFQATRNAEDNEGCECCDVVPPGDACEFCSGDTPSEITITASGFTGCTQFNGTFVLPQSGSFVCAFINGDIGGSFQSNHIQINFTVFGTVRAQYIITRTAPYDCYSSPLTLTKSFDDGLCGAPATIELTI